MGPHTLSVVLPAYNEEGNIETAISHALAVLPSCARDFEVIVVDDCSRDRTGELALAYARRDRHVRVVTNSRNLGLGGSMRAGFEASRGELVFYTDSDLPIDMADLAPAVPLMSRYDLVAGYRLNRDEGVRRALYSWAYNRLVSWLFGLGVRDVNFSFKLVKRGVLEAVELRSRGSFIDVELLAETVAAGFAVGEMGVRYTPRVWGTSTLASPRVIRGILVEMSAYRHTRRRIRR
ncbi:glycosyltransferase family 2 protein [Candidatus Fermentibacteria bacterium]|nr:glycosyltransferase family 2 protein [Candidatus Fermentibacteria bacterium]